MPTYPPMTVIHILRKPLEGPLYKNALQWGTGGLSINQARIPFAEGEESPSAARRQTSKRTGVAPSGFRIKGSRKETDARGQWVRRGSVENYHAPRPDEDLGRWPTNVLFEGAGGEANPDERFFKTFPVKDLEDP